MNIQDDAKSTEFARIWNDATSRQFDLGKCGEVTIFLSRNRKRLLIGFDVQQEGFDKTGVNAFIEALEKMRGKMER
jgi:hypothetical protein